jgi:ferritin
MKTVNEKTIELLKRQVNLEAGSEIIYRNSSSVLKSQGYKGFSKFLKIEAHGERKHSMRFTKFLEKLGEIVEVNLNEVIPSKTTLKEIFEQVLEREIIIRDSIGDIITEAEKHNLDYGVVEFCLQFQKIQVKEIDTMQEIVTRLNLAGDNIAAVLILDKEYRK